jgi:hypothetical protein
MDVAGWPTRPKKLRAVDSLELLSFLGDVVLLLFSLAFAGQCDLLFYFTP